MLGRLCFKDVLLVTIWYPLDAVVLEAQSLSQLSSVDPLDSLSPFSAPLSGLGASLSVLH